MKTTKITTVNGVDIVELADSMIPIKPICEALGIDSDSQRQKINNNEILKSVTVLCTATGSDHKQYEMVCLPLKYIFGWLFTINPNKVRDDVQDSVLQYQKECYDAIYDSLFLSKVYLKEMKEKTEEKLKQIEEHKSNFKEAQGKLKKAESELKELRQFSFDDWKASTAQISMLDQKDFVE